MSETQYNPVNDQRYNALHDWVHAKLPTATRLTSMATDAGMRRYYRVHSDNSTCVAVDADPMHEDSNAFLNIAARITRTGLHVPEVYHYNLEKGFLLLEDLGDRHLQQWLLSNPASAVEMYGKACDAMITLQHRADATGLPAFDHDFIRFELAIFEDWYLRRHMNYPISQQTARVLEKVKSVLVDNCAQQPQVFMHRDFHSRNLMVTSPGEIAIIDFQGAMLGPVTYDLGSLLKDVYAPPPPGLEETLRGRHMSTLAKRGTESDYERWYQLTALQRHLKVMGLFCRLFYRDGKPQYLSHLDAVAGHIRATLQQYRELTDFCTLFEKLSTGDGKG
jgi:aminoglycoside/choline kinase family phosphotransferase